MIRLEQVRGEMLERFERVDRRFAQNEQRAGRVEQRLIELTERIEALRQELAAQLSLSGGITGVDGVEHDAAAMAAPLDERGTVADPVVEVRSGERLTG